MSMALVISHHPLSCQASGFSRIRHRFSSRRWLSCSDDSFRFENFNTRCSMTNADIHYNHVATEESIQKDISAGENDCPVSFVDLTPDVLEIEPLNLLTENTYVDSLLTTLPVLSEEEQNALAATPAHPAGLYGKGRANLYIHVFSYQLFRRA